MPADRRLRRDAQTGRLSPCRRGPLRSTIGRPIRVWLDSESGLTPSQAPGRLAQPMQQGSASINNRQADAAARENLERRQQPGGALPDVSALAPRPAPNPGPIPTSLRLRLCSNAKPTRRRAEISRRWPRRLGSCRTLTTRDRRRQSMQHVKRFAREATGRAAAATRDGGSARGEA